MRLDAVIPMLRYSVKKSCLISEWVLRLFQIPPSVPLSFSLFLSLSFSRDPITKRIIAKIALIAGRRAVSADARDIIYALKRRRDTRARPVLSVPYRVIASDFLFV